MLSKYKNLAGIEKLDNDIYPDRPNISGWECPVIDIFDR